jgi:N-acetylglucosamine kinase-like BadF-type ATPase
MILLADSGSSTTNWLLLSYSTGQRVVRIDTKGLNPYHLSKEEIAYVIMHDLIPSIKDYEIDAIYFYGSGCSNAEKQHIIKQCLTLISPNAELNVDHDIMASAIACCGENKGIACILGTGSNSCVYDGNRITKNLPSLGYMLGDEGSGAYIGKALLQLFLKNQLPKHLHNSFNDKYGLHSVDILNRIYQHEKPGVFIAQFAQFVYEHIDETSMLSIVHKSFRDFFDELVLPYPESLYYPIHFVGSIAALFSTMLHEVGTEKSLQIGRIVRYPIEALADYYINKLR